MNRLIMLLKLAHSIEIGAYHAYEGHWRNTKDPVKRKRLQKIQTEENFHRQQVHFMLDEVKSSPSLFLDLSMYLIGKFVSVSCYVIGYRAAMWGAKIFEVLGSKIYWNAAIEALNIGNTFMFSVLMDMNRTELEHEKFFRTCLMKDPKAKKVPGQ